MKRSLTIILLALFLLNVLGYYGVFIGLQFVNEQEMRALFDADNLAPEEEITFEVPITIPYATNSTEFTRVDGEFEHKGEVYRMVKQRYMNDVLYIVCVKDNKSKKIKEAMSDYAKTFTDKPSSEKSNSKTIQNFIKDFVSTSTSIQSGNGGWFHEISATLIASSFQNRVLSLISPPPKS